MNDTFKIFFISDTHFGDDRILQYENRPFKSVDRMDKTIIDLWDSVVSPQDIVWHLGDFGADGREADILKLLNGTKFLVRGNHDTRSNEYYKNAGFEWVYDHPIVLYNFWILSHEPMYINSNMPYINIFGHVHGNPIYKDISQQHACVCVERTHYKPIWLEDLSHMWETNDGQKNPCL